MSMFCPFSLLVTKGGRSRCVEVEGDVILHTRRGRECGVEDRGSVSTVIPWLMYEEALGWRGGVGEGSVTHLFVALTLCFCSLPILSFIYPIDY